MKKVNIMSRQNTRFVQKVTILWAHQFQSVKSLRAEYGVIAKSKRSVRTRRCLWVAAVPNCRFRILYQTAFVLRTEAVFVALAACDTSSEAALAAWKAWSEAA